MILTLIIEKQSFICFAEKDSSHKLVAGPIERVLLLPQTAKVQNTQKV